MTMDEVRMKRIDRIIRDLQYEVAAGVHTREIDEDFISEYLLGRADNVLRLSIKLETLSEYEKYSNRYVPDTGIRLVKG